MLVELRQKSQVTIPEEIIAKPYLDELRKEISDVKSKLASGEQPTFDSVDALFDKLEAE